jgi:pSer/pThr/pTyr-binding forkhead associated (FHA) protein
MDDAKTPEGFVPLKLVLQPSGMAVELTKPQTIIGRHTSSDLRLPLPDVSRQHCRLVFAEGCWHVYDLNSTNGVFVNNERVEHAVLRHGDLVRLGGFTFQLDIQSAGTTVKIPANAGERVIKSIVDALDNQTPPRRQAS